MLPLTIADQQQHIERSEQLLSTVSLDEPPTLYWSQAESIGLVLGYSQKQDMLNPSGFGRDKSGPYQPLPIYHRRAGGTAVLVGPHLLSLDVVLPPAHPLVLPDIVESYRWLGEAWVKALRSLGIETRTAGWRSGCHR